MAGYILDPLGPLTTQEIRLLEVYPSAAAEHDLRCRLFRVPLSALQDHTYEALSYVWGDASMRADIICNGESVSVTINLCDALKRLRLSEKPRFIWADAICIDQKSASEKSCQIPLMGKIYSSSERVVVWLGSCDLAEAEEALDSVRLIANHLTRIREESGLESMTWEAYNELQMPSNYTNDLAHEFLQGLYARPWFSRVWCIQEIILAKNAVFLWGDVELSWIEVGEIATWLSNLEPTRALALEDDAFYAGIEYTNADRVYAIRRRRLDLLNTISDCRLFQATDPRDMVYGVLALVEAEEDVEALSVDYNKDVGEVYADVVITEIRSYSTLDVLAYVNHGAEYYSGGYFTSWTPQWQDLATIGVRRLPHDDSEMSACQDKVVEAVDESHLNSQFLRLRGLSYNSVTTIHAEMDLENMKGHSQHPFLDIIITVMRPHFDDQDRTKIAQVFFKLACTLTAGCTDRNDITAADQQEMENFYKSFEGCVKCLCSGLDFLEFRKEHLPQESFYDEAEIVCLGRRFFWMENGSFGIGPACMKRGDVVVVLFGGRTPYILRPCGRSYLYIGQAYVDELMTGWLIEEMEGGRVQEQEFFLV